MVDVHIRAQMEHAKHPGLIESRRTLRKRATAEHISVQAPGAPEQVLVDEADADTVAAAAQQQPLMQQAAAKQPRNVAPQVDVDIAAPTACRKRGRPAKEPMAGANEPSPSVKARVCSGCRKLRNLPGVQGLVNGHSISTGRAQSCKEIGGRPPSKKENEKWKVAKRTMDRNGTYDAFVQKLIVECGD